jgi:hypothetical protein
LHDLAYLGRVEVKKVARNGQKRSKVGVCDEEGMGRARR